MTLTISYRDLDLKQSQIAKWLVGWLRLKVRV